MVHIGRGFQVEEEAGAGSRVERGENGVAYLLCQ